MIPSLWFMTGKKYTEKCLFFILRSVDMKEDFAREIHTSLKGALKCQILGIHFLVSLPCWRIPTVLCLKEVNYMLNRSYKGINKNLMKFRIESVDLFDKIEYIASSINRNVNNQNHTVPQHCTIDVLCILKCIRVQHCTCVNGWYIDLSGSIKRLPMGCDSSKIWF